MKKNFNTSGFTLIELLVVVLIIGILAAVALPQYQLAVAKARLATIRPVLATLKQAQEIYYMENGFYANDVNQLDVNLPNCTSPVDMTGWICGDFMIDSISGNTGTVELYDQNLRAAYCPEEIKGDKKWAQCAYENGHFMYRVWLEHSALPNKIDCVYALTSLGQKMCQYINSGN